MLYSYKSAAPLDPPEPAVIVALGLKPAQIVVPLAGVAVFKLGLTVVVETGQVQIVFQAEFEHPKLPLVLRD